MWAEAASASGSGWPEAVAALGTLAFMAFVLWLVLR